MAGSPIIDVDSAAATNPAAAEFQQLLLEEQVAAFLGRLQEHHADTHAHSIRVGRYSYALALLNKQGEQERRIAGFSALLHDLGKVRIPLTILDKPGRLDEGELAVMRGHPRLGFLELEGFPYEDVCRVVVSHHEYKGDAYPRCGTDRRQAEAYMPAGRSHQERRQPDPVLATLAQIVAAADIYDALASARSYKQPLPLAEIERIMRTQFKGEPRYIDQVLELGRGTAL